MGVDMAIDREKLTVREVQILDHLKQARSLGVPLTEYASAYDVDVRDLYTGKAALLKKGVLARSPAAEKSDFVPVRVTSRAISTACRLSHPSGWSIECASLPDAAWVLTVLRGRADDPT
jgi:hypothetical protein